MSFPLSNILNMRSMVVAYFDFWTVVTASAYTYTMTINGTVGEKLYIDWGDGNEDSYTLTGANQIITHEYNAGTFQQKWAVNKLAITLLRASSQRLSGALPLELQAFYSLTDIHLYSNSFNSNLGINNWDTELAKWAGMVDFRFYDNDFTGDLSGWSALSTWTSVQNFYLYNNNFSGDLSSWSALSTWVNIRFFYLYNNSFTGDLSSWSALSTWTNILFMLIFSNNFSGDLSSWSALSTWVNIIQFRVDFNNFSGDLSSWSAFSTWANIQRFYVNTNSFSGDLSSWSALSTWTSLQIFYIYSNNFSGDLSSWSTLSTWSGNLYVRIELNNFTGYIADLGHANWNSLLQFFAYSNNFTGLNDNTHVFFDNRASYTAATKAIQIQDNLEPLTGIHQQPDLGTYTGSVHDLTETQISNLANGLDYTGSGTNIPWSTLEKVWVLENLDTTSSSGVKRYAFTYTYDAATTIVKVPNSGARGYTEGSSVDVPNSGGASTTDWVDSNSDGEPDNYFPFQNMLGARITGSGFTGFAQRLITGPAPVTSSVTSNYFPVVSGAHYRPALSYRTGVITNPLEVKPSNVPVGVYTSLPLPENTGNATEIKGNVFTAVSASAFIYMPVTTFPDEVFEIDNLRLINVFFITDFVDTNTDGLADSWNTSGGGTPSITTGNGFFAKAQRLTYAGTIGYSLFTDLFALVSGSYRILIRYRSTVALTIRLKDESDNVDGSTTIPINTADAKIFITPVFTFTGTNARVDINSGNAANGEYFEIDEIMIIT